MCILCMVLWYTILCERGTTISRKKEDRENKKNTINVNYFYHMRWISQSVKNKT